jgi:hypothetical protein
MQIYNLKFLGSDSQEGIRIRKLQRERERNKERIKDPWKKSQVIPKLFICEVTQRI